MELLILQYLSSWLYCREPALSWNIWVRSYIFKLKLIDIYIEYLNTLTEEILTDTENELRNFIFFPIISIKKHSGLIMNKSFINKYRHNCLDPWQIMFIIILLLNEFSFVAVRLEIFGESKEFILISKDTRIFSPKIHQRISHKEKECFNNNYVFRCKEEIFGRP